MGNIVIASLVIWHFLATAAALAGHRLVTELLAAKARPYFPRSPASYKLEARWQPEVPQMHVRQATADRSVFAGRWHGG